MPGILLDNYLPSRQNDGPSSYAGGLVDQINGRNFAHLRRPYVDRNGRAAVSINKGRFTVNKGERVPLLEHVTLRDLADYGILSPVANATTLRKEEWVELDRVILRAARYRMRAWADLAAANSFGGFNAMAKSVLEHETMADVGEAIVDMDALTAGRNDTPKFQLEGLPLPITHSDFWYSARELAISRASSTPLDTTMGEMAGRRVAEAVEKTTIGNQTGITYVAQTQQGGYGRTPTVYGYTNFTNRITLSGLYKPTGNGSSGTGWKPADTLANVLTCRQKLLDHKFWGPYMLYHSNDWDTYMDNDYFISTTTQVSTQTLRERLKSIEGIQDVRRLDFLFASTTDASSGGPGLEHLAAAYPFTLLFVQMTPDVCRAVNGMDITTVQWETVGGMRLNFKVMCIQVPQLRADFYGNCGVLHATATV